MTGLIPNTFSDLEMSFGPEPPTATTSAASDFPNNAMDDHVQPAAKISHHVTTHFDVTSDPGYDNVNDLNIDDVEAFLERVEARKSECQPCGTSGEPPSPFYGRTTPMMFDFQTSSCQMPFQQYTSDPGCLLPTAETSLTLLESAAGVSSTFADAETLIGRENAVPDYNSKPERGIVPDFSLLNDCPSPAPSSSNGSAVTMPEETLDPEPIVSQLIKSELREQITKRRRQSGKDDIVVDLKNAKVKEEDQLTEKDLERRRRRRESNRRAAQKSRVKKRFQNDVVHKEMEDMKLENVQLKDEVELLRKELKSMTSTLYEHIKNCPNPGSLATLLHQQDH